MAAPRQPPQPADRPSGALRRAIFDEIRDRPCVDCGRKFPVFVMQFDHARGSKSFEVAEGKYYAFDRLLDEMKKCDLVCANCHTIRTHQRRVRTSARRRRFPATDWSLACSVPIDPADALTVGQTLRALAFTKACPLGDTTAAFERVGSQLVAAARLSLATEES